MNSFQDPKQQIEQGNSLYSQGKYEEAIRKYQEACEISPSNSQGYYNWGNALRRQGKLEEAIAKYKKALEVNPNISQAYNNWGLVLNDQKKYKEAVQKFSKAIEINPSFPHAYNNWGLALDAQGEYEEAIVKYKKATDLNPKYSEAYYNWGNTLFAMEDYDKAGFKYSQATEANPRYSQAYHNWGVMLSAKEEYEQAIQKFSKAIDIDPYYSDAYNNWALILYDQKKYIEAVQVVARGVKALAKHPENKTELIKLFTNEMSHDEKELTSLKNEGQKAELKTKMSGIKQILDVLIEPPSPKPETYKDSSIAQSRQISGPSGSPEKKEKTEVFSHTQNISEIGTDTRVNEYYTFLIQELTTLFGKTFALKGNKLEERTEIVLPGVTFAAGFLPTLYDVSFDDKIFPLISKIAPDGVTLEDVFIIRKVNKVFQQFIGLFTNQEDLKLIIQSVAKELTLIRKDAVVAEYSKAVNPKSLTKLKQAKARDFVTKYQLASKAEELAFLDIGIVMVLFFLEGLRIEEYGNAVQKAENLGKAVGRVIKEFHNELKNEGKMASDWCNVM